MGLFRNAGRRVEELKQQMTEAADDEARADCGECGTSIFSDRETCPECGSDDLVVRADPADE